MRRLAVAAAFSVALFAFSALRQADVALDAMHLPGEASVTMSEMVGPRLPWAGATWDDAVRTWSDWRLAAQPAVAPTDVVWFHLVVDTALGLAVAYLLWRATTWLGSTTLRPGGVSPELRRALRDVLAVVPVVIAAYLALDVVVENPLVAARVGAGWAWAGEVAPWASAAKWLAVVLALVPIVVALAAIALSPRGRDRLALGLRRVVALRAQLVAMLVVLGLLVLRGDLGAQIVDVILRWGDGWGQAAWTLGLAALVTLAIAVGGWLTLRWHERPPAGGPLRRDTLAALTVAGLLATAIGGWALWRREPDDVLGGLFVGALPIGIGLLAFALLSWPDGVRRLDQRSDRAATVVGDRVADPGPLLPILTALPGWVLGVLVVRAVVILYVEGYGAHTGPFVGLALGFGALSVLAPVVTAHAMPGARSVRRPLGAMLLALGVGVPIVLAAWGVAAPWGFGEMAGSTAVLLVFSAVLGWVLVGLVWAGDRLAALGVLALVGLRRVPFIALALAFVVSVSVLDREFSFHDARMLQEERSSEPLALSAAFARWLDEQPDGHGPTPMVFVATAGGGIRSAYWTSQVLACVLTEAPPGAGGGPPSGDLCPASLPASSIFLASGISGGSLGLVASFAGGDAGQPLSEDFLAPTLARFLFVDLPNAFLRLDRVADRAEVLERSWERAWLPAGERPLALRPTDDSPLADGLFGWQLPAGSAPRFPLLLLNSAAVDDGCRIAGGVLDAAVDPPAEPPAAGASLPDTSCASLAPFTQPPDPFPPDSSPAGASEAAVPPDLAARADAALVRTRDLHELTCSHDDRTANDLRLSTTALLSARFPFVTPSGGLYVCPGTAVGGDEALERTFAVDGGAIETSAAKPLEELFGALAPLVAHVNATSDRCVEPRLVLLDNEYQSTARREDEGRPLEAFVPLDEASLGARLAPQAARQEAALAFARFFPGSCAVPDGGGERATATPVEGGAGAACPYEPTGSSVAFLTPTQQPGFRAPLGWTLSSYSRHDLREQLGSDWNRCQLELIDSWLAPDDSATG